MAQGGLKVRVQHALRCVHIWIGWLIGIPLAIWILSGLAMALLPIETVRGEHLVKEAPPLSLAAPPVPPIAGPRAVASLTLEQRPWGARWLVRYTDGGSRLAHPATGRLLPPLTAEQATQIVRARYTGKSPIKAVGKTEASDPPLELRREVESWRVSLADGTRFYVNTATGEILARRTGTWRFYDFMRGLHIMDLQSREDINNKWLVIFGAISALSVIMALVLLPMSVREPRRKRLE